MSLYKLTGTGIKNQNNICLVGEYLIWLQSTNETMVIPDG